jgi:hypothetical protein
MLTVKGFFGDGNGIITDKGEVIIAYPFGIDFNKIYHKSGYFLLKERDGDGDEREYTVVNYLIDERQTEIDLVKYGFV